MKKLPALAALPFLVLAACGAPVDSTSSSHQAIVESSSDSAGCGDGVKSAPNGWFISAKASEPADVLFQEVALISSNLFSITNIAPTNPSADVSISYPDDVTQVTELNFLVTFRPGVDSVGLPTIHEDSIAYRNQTLTQLKGLGVTIGCNAIGVARPLNGASAASAASGTPDPDGLDSLGCGDGTKSTPNVWFMSIAKSDAPLFHEIALLSENLFNAKSVVAVNPSSDTTLTYPTDVSGTTELDFEETFSPGVNSVGFPHIAADSIAYRDATLIEMKELGLTISCNDIGVAQPLAGQ